MLFSDDRGEQYLKSATLSFSVFSVEMLSYLGGHFAWCIWQVEIKVPMFYCKLCSVYLFDGFTYGLVNS